MVRVQVVLGPQIQGLGLHQQVSNAQLSDLCKVLLLRFCYKSDTGIL
jgi:hypothetical protein